MIDRDRSIKFLAVTVVIFLLLGSSTNVMAQQSTVIALRWSPEIVPSGLSGVVAISAGESHNLALKNDGTVVAWGNNDQGQSTVPSGLSGVVAISAGSYHSLALKNDGTVVTWGYASRP